MYKSLKLLMGSFSLLTNKFFWHKIYSIHIPYMGLFDNAGQACHRNLCGPTKIGVKTIY